MNINRIFTLVFCCALIQILTMACNSDNTAIGYGDEKTDNTSAQSGQEETSETTEETANEQADDTSNQPGQEEGCDSTEQTDAEDNEDNDQERQCVFPQEEEEDISSAEMSEEDVIGIRVVRWDPVLRVDPYAYEGALYDNYCDEIYNHGLVIPVESELVPYFNDYSTCYFVCEEDLPNTYFYWADTGHPALRLVEMYRAVPDSRIEDRKCYCVSYPHMLVVVEGSSPQNQF